MKRKAAIMHILLLYQVQTGEAQSRQLYTTPHAIGNIRSAPFLTDPGFLTILIGVLLVAAVAEILVWRLQVMRKRDLEAQRRNAEMMELQDKALRAQMNPHFLFNCLNSIKALVQESRNDLAVTYLTTFTKLMRTVLQNADRQFISLHDELETCRLYMELEAMRFGNRFSFQIDVQDGIDLKAFDIPTLFIQPLVENAIWHGLMPKDGEGKLTISVVEKNGHLLCTVDDDGIGRQASEASRVGRSSHQPKGVKLTSARIDLYSMLKDNHAAMEIIDKRDEAGRPTGTRVEIAFSMN